MNTPSDLTLLTPPGPISLDLHWQPTPPPIPAHAAAHIEARWSNYLSQASSQGHTLFDGPITQLFNAHTTPISSGTLLTLHLAPARYKDFVVTRLRDRPWFESHAPECHIGALGNSALLTHGHQVLLGRRSPRVSSYAGRFHMIGGVLEALGTPQFPATRAGIEAHLFLELHEEIGLAAGEERRDHWPRVLGLARDEFLGQPELFWQWEVSIPLETLRQRLDPAEHSAAVILDRDQMTPDLWQQLTPVARQAWQLWTAMQANKNGP